MDKVMLITKVQREKLLKNGREHPDYKETPPVVKLFTPDAQCTWLLFELVPEDPDMAFGLADLGMGFPEMGYIDLREIRETPAPMGLPVERDRHFHPVKSLKAYVDEARAKRRIVA